VSARRFVNGAQSINLENVTKTHILREKPRSGLALLAAIVSAPLTLFAFLFATLDEKATLWVVVFASLTAWSLSRAFKVRKFTLELHTEGKDIHSLVSSDEGFIDRVNAAIAEAQSTSILPGRKS